MEAAAITDAISSPQPPPHAAQVSEKATEPPNPTSNPQPDNHNHNEKASDVTTPAAPAPAPTGTIERTSKSDNVISFSLNWICVVLTVVATIVFGIWAPLSYRATADGNRDNNLVQSSMMQQVMTANDIASSALRAASAQSTNLASMQSRLGAMGQLAMVDFCLTQTAVTACSHYATVVPLPDIISYLASIPRAATSTPASASSAPTAVGSPTQYPVATSRSSGQLPVEALLGLVFGMLTLLGLAAGFFVWRTWKERAAMAFMEPLRSVRW